MIIRVPDTLTADSSERYTMSIRLQSGGLSFSGHCDSADGSFFYREVLFGRNQSYLSALKECFFDNEFLGWRYKRLHVTSTTNQYQLYPASLVPNAAERIAASMRRAFTEFDATCLSQALPDEQTVVLFGIDKEVHDFCLRSLQQPIFTHYLADLLAYYRRRSQTEPYKNMYVWVDGDRMNVICYVCDRLQYANDFLATQLSDRLYNLCSVWRYVGFDPERDALRIYAEPSLRASFLEEARRYFRNAQGLTLPSELFLMGDEVMQAPLDQIALLLCES